MKSILEHKYVSANRFSKKKTTRHLAGLLGKMKFSEIFENVVSPDIQWEFSKIFENFRKNVIFRNLWEIQA